MTMERICRNCEYYDDGTGEHRTADSGDCLNRWGPRFQMKPTDTCPHWFADSSPSDERRERAREER